MIIVLYSLIGTITCPDSRDYDPKRNRDTSVIFQWNYLVHLSLKGKQESRSTVLGRIDWDVTGSKGVWHVSGYATRRVAIDQSTALIL